MPTISRHTAGVYAVAPTPFTDVGDVDLRSFERLLDCYEEAGVSGVTVLGQMGEAPKLLPDEALSLVARATARDSLSVVVGVSAPGLAAMRSLSGDVMDLGAAGVLVAPPNTLRTDDQIVGYYDNAVQAIGPDVPFAVQDYPLTMSVVMSTAVIGRIVTNHQSCVMLKHEDWPGLEKITALRMAEGQGQPRLSILCGNGGLFLDHELERGADGAMTGYCYPELLTRMCEHHGAGAGEQLHDLFDLHLPLLRYEQQPGVGLAVRKYVLTRRGILAHDAQRAPSSGLSAAARAEIDEHLVRLARRDDVVAESLRVRSVAGAER